MRLTNEMRSSALIGVLHTVTRSASERAAFHSLALRVIVGHASVLRNTPIKARSSGEAIAWLTRIAPTVQRVKDDLRIWSGTGLAKHLDSVQNAHANSRIALHPRYDVQIVKRSEQHSCPPNNG